MNEGSLYAKSKYSAFLHCKDTNLWYYMKSVHSTVAKKCTKKFVCVESNLQLDKEVVDLGHIKQIIQVVHLS